MFFEHINYGPVTAGIFIFVVTGMIYSIVRNTIRRKQQNTIHTRLLEKFTSSQDFSAFLQTPGGQQYMNSLTDSDNNPGRAILSSVSGGIVLAVVGAGLLAAGLMLRDIGTGISGLLLLLVGTGFILSALVSYKLSRKLGLIRDHSETSGT
jgi:hypothetical protein